MPRRERIAKQLILANLGESLAIADLAQACALSRSHFSVHSSAPPGCRPRNGYACNASSGPRN